MTSGSTHMFWWEDPPIPTHGFQLSSPCTSLGCADHRVSWTSLQSQTSAFCCFFVSGGGAFFFCHRKMMSKSIGKPVKSGMPNYHINWELIYLHTRFFFLMRHQTQTNALISTGNPFQNHHWWLPLFWTQPLNLKEGLRCHQCATWKPITLSSPRIFGCQACEAAAKACLKPAG